VLLDRAGLKEPFAKPDGTLVPRRKGVPQGSVTDRAEICLMNIASSMDAGEGIRTVPLLLRR